MDNSISTEHLPAFISKMEAEGLPPLVIDTFSFYYKQVLTGKTGMIYDHDILPVASEEIEDAAQLDRFTDAGRNAFPHAVRIVLNGGLGTSMGLMGPKSLLEAKSQTVTIQACSNGVDEQLQYPRGHPGSAVRTETAQDAPDISPT
jgi:UTP--glucose-1-phosphate uridylyltransferase